MVLIRTFDLYKGHCRGIQCHRLRHWMTVYVTYNLLKMADLSRTVFIRQTSEVYTRKCEQNHELIVIGDLHNLTT